DVERAYETCVSNLGLQRNCTPTRGRLPCVRLMSICLSSNWNASWCVTFWTRPTTYVAYVNECAGSSPLPPRTSRYTFERRSAEPKPDARLSVPNVHFVSPRR